MSETLDAKIAIALEVKPEIEAPYDGREHLPVAHGYSEDLAFEKNSALSSMTRRKEADQERRKSQTPAPSSTIKTGTSTSGKEQGPPCFDYKKGSLQE